MNRSRTLPFAFAVATLFIGCQQKSEEQTNPTSAQSTVVAVTSQVALEITKELAGSHFEVQKVVPDSTVSRLWTPESKDIKAIQKAGLIFLQGAGYDPWKDRASLPGSRVTDVSKGIYDDFIRIPDAISHQHGPEGKHSHPGTVWATWLNPELVLPQISVIEATLAKKNPNAANEISKASAVLRSKIQAQIEKTESLRSSLDGRKVIVVADNCNYLYLAKTLGLECRYLHWPESGELNEEQLQEFQTLLKDVPSDGLRIFLIDAGRPESAHSVIKDAGFRMVPIETCESAASESVWKRLAGNIERLTEAFKP